MESLAEGFWDDRPKSRTQMADGEASSFKNFRFRPKTDYTRATVGLETNSQSEPGPDSRGLFPLSLGEREGTIDFTDYADY